jgi:hypothetical protein
LGGPEGEGARVAEEQRGVQFERMLESKSEIAIVEPECDLKSLKSTGALVAGLIVGKND